MTPTMSPKAVRMSVVIVKRVDECHPGVPNGRHRFPHAQPRSVLVSTPVPSN
jgi:putative component of membrane protein insertase Oxa1/YidC/SpoIIIJ protein YidD